MRFSLKKEPRGLYEPVEVEEGTTLDQFVRATRDQAAYPVYLAKIGNRYADLREKIPEGAWVELLDMRNRAAQHAYVDSLCLLFITAVDRVMGGTRIEIANSLNQGMYIEVRGTSPVPPELTEKIAAEMRRLSGADELFRLEQRPRDEVIQILEDQGKVTHTVDLIRGMAKERRLPIYTIAGMHHFAYGFIVPSAGYLGNWELHSYKRGVLLRYPNDHLPDQLPPYRDQPKLYEAFSEQKRWDRITGVNYVQDLNRQIQEGEFREMVQISEALHEKRIAEIADRIKEEKRRIILIAGPSSSGKTTFARRLCVQLRVNGMSPLYMGTDDYFVEREHTPHDANGEPNYEGFDALDVDLFNRNMNDLLAGKKADLPTFNFLTGHKEFGLRVTSVGQGQPIVIEGIHGLNARLTEEIPQKEKFKIYISPLTGMNIDEHNRVPTTDERLLRRLVRDYLYRGHDAAATLESWPKVRAGEDENIFPYSGEADALFNSYHIYEIPVLKRYAVPLLEKVGPEDPNYAEAQWMLDFLKYFREVKDDRAVPNNSIIREFIGGSIFVE